MKASMLIIAATAFIGFGSVTMAQTSTPSTPSAPQTTMPSTLSPRARARTTIRHARPMYYGSNIRQGRRQIRRAYRRSHY
jgi:hypothetical protein